MSRSHCAGIPAQVADVKRPRSPAMINCLPSSKRGGSSFMGTPCLGMDKRILRQSGNLDHRPDLYRPPAACGNFACDTDGLIQIAGFDEEETAELFARFSERTVGYHPMAVLKTNAGGR